MLLDKAIEAFEAHLKSKERSPETVRGYRMTLQEFSRHIERDLNGRVYLDEITLGHLEGYLAYRKQQGDQPVSRNRALYIFRSFWQFLAKRDLVDRDLSQKLEPIKLQQKERLHLPAEELEALLQAVEPPVVRAAVTALAYTGLRVSELCSLTLGDVNLESGLIRVRAGKGNKDRTVPISGKLKAVLERYLEQTRNAADSDRFFATRKTGKLSPVHINRCLQEATERLGWRKHVTAHILRHSFASNLVRNRASLPAVQSLLGHSDLRVTSRYIHQNLDELKGAVNLI